MRASRPSWVVLIAATASTVVCTLVNAWWSASAFAVRATSAWFAT